ncbi:MAG: hypothetical protein HYY04_02190 [Chloroflexi bacterium]|nr:hypothetical protein [Chloroflexota bacterium]
MRQNDRLTRLRRPGEARLVSKMTLIALAREFSRRTGNPPPRSLVQVYCYLIASGRASGGPLVDAWNGLLQEYPTTERPRAAVQFRREVEDHSQAVRSLEDLIHLLGRHYRVLREVIGLRLPGW